MQLGMKVSDQRVGVRFTRMDKFVLIQKPCYSSMGYANDSSLFFPLCMMIDDFWIHNVKKGDMLDQPNFPDFFSLHYRLAF